MISHNAATGECVHACMQEGERKETSIDGEILHHGEYIYYATV